MLRGKELIAVIPARSGSKGIPGKNLYKINGETLVERTLRLAQSTGQIDRILVTTNNPEIYQISKNYNAAPPNLRPDHLSTDSALTIDAVKNVLEDAGIEEGYILLLQVTTPLRTTEDLQSLLKKFEDNPEAEAIVSVVCHKSPHPEKLLVKENDYLKSYTGRDPGVPRQSLPDVYALNGAFYLTTLDVIENKATFLPEKTISFDMPPERSVNLDEPLDLLLLEAIIRKNQSNAS